MTTPAAPAPSTPAAAPAAPADRFLPASGPSGVVAVALARARAAAAALPPPGAGRPDPLAARPAAPPAAVAPPAAAKKPQIDADAASLNQWAKLQSENRALQAKIKTLEPAAAEAATLATARKLYGEGKRIEAVALLANATDATAEMESLMADYIKGGTAAEEITAAQLADQLAKEKIAQKKADDEKSAKDEEARKTAAAEADARGAREYVSRVLDDPAMAAKFERCVRPANRDEAAAEVVRQVAAAAVAQKLAPEAMTPEITRKLIEDAYEAVEAEYDLLAARYSKGALQTPPAAVQQESSQRASAFEQGRREKPEPGTPPAPTIDASLSRPGVVPQPPRRFYSHEEAAARAREAAARG